MDDSSLENETVDSTGTISEGLAILSNLVTALRCVITAGACLMLADFFRLPNLSNFAQALEFSWQMAALGVLLTPVCIALALGVKFFQLAFVGDDPHYGERNLSTVTCMICALLAGVSEEILFRGALQPLLGIWLTSAAFGLMHIDSREDWPYAFYTFGYGLIFAVTFFVTGSLWVPIIVHVLNNYLASKPPHWYASAIVGIYQRALSSGRCRNS